MIKIAHRGNTSGISAVENSPTIIEDCLKKGYEVEVDVWYDEGWKEFKLGHDRGQYPVDLDFLKTSGLWIHCKNYAAFAELLKIPSINCFMHDHHSWKNGVPALTSHKYIWMYPEVYNTDGSIYGICGDEL